MKRMCTLFGCLMSLMIGVSGAAFAEDLLVGTAYFLDQSGEVFVPHGGETRSVSKRDELGRSNMIFICR